MGKIIWGTLGFLFVMVAIASAPDIKRYIRISTM
jgi:hypothetical protein